MKKVLKPILAIALCIMLCLSLCSCQMLDEMRSEQAFYTTEAEDEILWNGVTYKQLDLGNDAVIFADSYDFGGYITDPDVPVLLSNTMGSSFSIVNPYGFIHGNYDRYYCKLDDYDRYSEIINNYTLNHYAYVTSQWSQVDFDYEESLNFIDDEIALAIDDIFANYNIKGAFNYQYDYLYVVYRTDDTKMFYNTCFDVIEVTGMGYFLQVENKITGYSYYKVPDEYKQYFDAIYLAIQQEKNDAWSDFEVWDETIF